jgi:hypothetical protein
METVRTRWQSGKSGSEDEAVWRCADDDLANRFADAFFIDTMQLHRDVGMGCDAGSKCGNGECSLESSLHEFPSL